MRQFQSIFFILLFFAKNLFYAQNVNKNDSLKLQILQEVVLISNRLETPLKNNSKTIQLITSEQIRQSGVTFIVDLLQQVAGLDIKRRGAGSVQADLNIRGGTFDQTLLLIDGIKLEDPQTGHHILNFLPPPLIIERIEIIKGPALRAYGQNAFTGAINIVTKKEIKDDLSFNLQKGNYDQTNGSIFFGKTSDNISINGSISKSTSDGYRHNTDYDINNYFIKSIFNRSKTPIDLIAFYSGRKFGANGFYATPSAIDQYEETQASLIAISQRLENGNWIFKPKFYWRRGQDMYEYIRDKPEIYRNLHLTNKIGISFDSTLSSSFGLTGLGIDFSRISIRSNNLGNHDREMLNFFLEHRFLFINEKFDITPGIVFNKFSDFGDLQIFPGIDIGFQLNKKLRFYGNIGSTYRIPTYTDLYYSDSTTIGNSDLESEESNSSEIGVRYLSPAVTISFAFFKRKSKNLIDYVKNNEEELWKAENIQHLATSGIDFEFIHLIRINELTHQFKIGYSYLKNKFIDDNNIKLSRYSINNDLKHHLIGTYSLPISKKIGAYFAYKYVERNQGGSYTVIDCSTQFSTGKVNISLYLNNILNTEYWESNLVPMPMGNGLFGITYSL